MLASISWQKRTHSIFFFFFKIHSIKTQASKGHCHKPAEAYTRYNYVQDSLRSETGHILAVKDNVVTTGLLDGPREEHQTDCGLRAGWDWMESNEVLLSTVSPPSLHLQQACFDLW